MAGDHQRNHSGQGLGAGIIIQAVALTVCTLGAVLFHQSISEPVDECPASNDGGAINLPPRNVAGDVRFLRSESKSVGSEGIVPAVEIRNAPTESAP